MDATWDRIAPSLSDDALLLAETAHRTLNEISAALAALSLLRAGRGLEDRVGLLDGAIARLNGFAAATRLLAGPWCGDVDLVGRTEELWRATVDARRAAESSMLVLDPGCGRVPSAVGRRALLVLAELMSNALRHAVADGRGTIAVVVSRCAGGLLLAVEDDGPGLPPGGARREGGMGGPIVSELVRRGGGTIEYETGPRGTAFRVVLPVTSQPGPGEPF